MNQEKILINYLPSYYRDILDFVELTNTEDTEVMALTKTKQRVFDNAFVSTSDTQAITRRERLLGIQANAQEETLDFRRLRILNRYQTKPPFTLNYLQQQLDFLVGQGRTRAEIDAQRFILTITTAIDDASLFKEVHHTIERIKPANVTYQQNTALQDRVVVKENVSTKAITWNYKLDGSWKVGEKPFISMGTEVVVK